jgi:hypothetical protein
MPSLKHPGTLGLRMDEVEKIAAAALALAQSKNERGPTGAAGQSIKGDRGEKGADGVSIKGGRGDPGLAGRDGRNGSDGKDAVGLRGDRGPAGHDGKDADTGVITAALETIQHLREEIMAEQKSLNQQRIEATVACQNAIKEQNAVIATLRREIENVRLMLQAMLDMNTKAATYVAWLKERTAQRRNKQ